jgi:hypothetical protein
MAVAPPVPEGRKPNLRGLAVQGPGWPLLWMMSAFAGVLRCVACWDV